MARGFESKDVEFQQAEAERREVSRPAARREDMVREDQRRGLELALSRARAERDAASNPNHRHMLDQAIAALEHSLQQI